MNAKKYISILDNLCSLTESAIQHARDDNFGPAIRCIHKRSMLLSKIRDMSTIVHGKESVRLKLLALHKRSDILRNIVQESLNSTHGRREKIKHMKGLRRRFAGKSTFIPKFIDKKM